MGQSAWGSFLENWLSILVFMYNFLTIIFYKHFSTNFLRRIVEIISVFILILRTSFLGQCRKWSFFKNLCWIIKSRIIEILRLILKFFKGKVCSIFSCNGYKHFSRFSIYIQFFIYSRFWIYWRLLSWLLKIYLRFILNLLLTDFGIYAYFEDLSFIAKCVFQYFSVYVYFWVIPDRLENVY